MIGQLLQGRYQVIRELGKGAFGQTYLATDTQYPGKPHCVVKRLQPDDPRSLEKAKQLFLREAEILAKLGKHDQIPELKAHSEQEFYLVQEFIDGHPLRDEILPSEPRWTENQVISLLSNILPVLVFIHDEGVIHRDIKPDNIMRRQRDHKLVLIDFGAIKEVLNNPATEGLSVAGSRVYTNGYAPSEQLIGKPRLNSDIYALGMTVLEALTGKYPHLFPHDDNTDEVIWQDKASVSSGLTAILNKMVSFSHRERYQSAAEVLLAVQQLIQASQAQAAKTSGVNQLTLEWQEAGQLRNITIQDKQQSKNPGTIRIGRDPAQCDIIFSDMTVSGLHVEIFFNQQQQCFYVRNLRQTNPPIIDGCPLPTGEVTFSQGSNIQLGQMNLKVTNISLGQSSSVAPTQLATTTKPTEVATSYQSSSSSYFVPTNNPAVNINQNAEIQYSLGCSRFELGEYKSAIEAFNYALSINSSYPEAYKQRGLTYLKLKKEEKAIQDFISALKSNPQDAELYKYLGRTRLELILISVSNREDFLVMQNSVDYNNPESYNHIDNLLYAHDVDLQAYIYESDNSFLGFNKKIEKFGQVLEKILEDFNSALRLNSNDAESYKYRGRLCVELKKYTDALKDFNAAWQLNPNKTIKTYQFYTYFRRGNSYLRLKEYQKAISDYSNALQIQTDNFQCLCNRGEAYLFSGIYEAAIADLKKALLLQPNDNYIASKLEEARAALNKSSQKPVKNPQPQLQKQSQPQNWKCKHIIKAHSDIIFSLAFSPDGQTLASCSGYWDKTIKLWNVHTGKEIRTLQGHTDGVRCVAFSPNGQILASGSSTTDKTIKLWNINTGLELHTLKGHSDVIYSIAFSPDGEILASGSQDKSIKLWNVSTGKELVTLNGHSDWVRSVAISPDGQILASGGSDDTIKLWRLKTRHEFQNFKANTSGVSSVRFSPNGELIASSGGDATIKLWNVTTKKEIRTLKGHVLEVYSIAFSPDGQTIASASLGGSIKLWNVQTGNELLTLKGHKGAVNSVRFSPDAKMIASCSNDENIRIWQNE